MPDYQNTKIYCIRSPNTEMVYIGSTVQKLCKRMTEHRRYYKCWKTENKKFCYSCKVLEFGDAYIELIEDYPCDNIEQQRAREGFYIRKNIKDGFNCGQHIAGRSKHEYYLDNRKKQILGNKKYVENNGEKRKQYLKKYREKNKEKLKEKHKKYREDNKEKIKERYKKWSKENKRKKNIIL